jgi:hypothetical protein
MTLQKSPFNLETRVVIVTCGESKWYSFFLTSR